jgi:DNA replication protein DnaC
MSCPLCQDSGWKLVERDGGSAVVRCDCWRQGLVDRLMAEAQIPARYAHCHLDRFITYSNEYLLRGVEQTLALIKDFPVVDRGLFFLGPPGVGKTHLAVAVLKAVIATKGARGLFYDTRELLRVIRSTYGADPMIRLTERDVLRPVLDVDLLVLDDLGGEKTSEWVDETLNYLVNSRYNEKRVTIFTSNYDNLDEHDLDSLQVRVGLRMYSRLKEMCEFVHLDGADFREADRNAGREDLEMLWTRRRRARTSRPGPRASTDSRELPNRSTRQARARVPEGSADLKWSGGRAGD